MPPYKSRWRRPALEIPNTNTPAAKIIIRFGGVKLFLEALALLGKPKAMVGRNQVYNWCKAPDRRGTSGFIPHWRIADIIAAARLVGILLQPEDFFFDTLNTHRMNEGPRRKPFRRNPPRKDQARKP